MSLGTPNSIFSRCRRYRYTLHRRWSESGKIINFVMLNPSTADDVQDDPTIRRCIGFAKQWGFGGLIVTNLFAFRSTNPTALRFLANPVGPENDTHTVLSAAPAERVICAWGAHGTLLGRDKKVLEILAAIQTPYCLGRTKEGHPRHPLYVSGDTIPIALTEPSTCLAASSGFGQPSACS